MTQKTWRSAARGSLLLVLSGLLGGCLTGASGPAKSSGTSAGGKTRLEFWHTRRGLQEKALRAICEEYGAANAAVEVVPTYQGNYDALNRKVRAAIQGRQLPALTVAYESHVTEYMTNNVILPLDALVSDPQIGLTKEELADIAPQYLASNRFPQHGNQLLSFPFTKSNLVLYYNKSMLAKAGFDKPPATWDEFEKQAHAITRQTGNPAYVFSVDASTLDGMIYAHGGEVIASDGRTTLFDQPPTVQTFEMLQRMARAKTLTEVDADDAGNRFTNQQCAFVMDTSSGRASAETEIGGKFEWDIAVIPHAAGIEPVTVMYGPNVCIFKSTPEQEKEAWKFVKFFVSPETTARWARETGYLPVRQSAVELPEMQTFYRSNPRARTVYDILKFARGEPNVLGWQEVRTHLQEAARKVVGTGTTPAAAAVELKRNADRTLALSK